MSLVMLQSDWRLLQLFGRANSVSAKETTDIDKTTHERTAHVHNPTRAHSVSLQPRPLHA